jgi:hypothetical protein
MKNLSKEQQILIAMRRTLTAFIRDVTPRRGCGIPCRRAPSRMCANA